MIKLFDVIPGFVWAILLVTTTTLAGFNYVRLKSEQADHAHTKQMVAEATQAAEQQARQIETRLRTQIDRIAANVQAKQVAYEARIAASNRTVASLRDTIAQLNARPAPADPGAAAFSDEASTARELLGACAEEYRAVAAEADQYATQVTGLQEYAASVSKNE